MESEYDEGAHLAKAVGAGGAHENPFGWWRLYGSGTGADIAGEAPALHVDAAARAAVLAIDKAQPGIYHVAEPSGNLSTDKPKSVLAFDAGYRLAAGIRK